MRKQLNVGLILVLLVASFSGCGTRDRATSIAIRTANAYAFVDGAYDAVVGLQQFGEMEPNANLRVHFIRITDALDAFSVAAQHGNTATADVSIRTVIQLFKDMNQVNVFGIKSDNTRRAVTEWLAVGEIWVGNIKLLLDKQKPVVVNDGPVRAQISRAQGASRGVSPTTIAFISSLFGSVALTAQGHYDLDKDGAWKAAADISARLRNKLQ